LKQYLLACRKEMSESLQRVADKARSLGDIDNGYYVNSLLGLGQLELRLAETLPSRDEIYAEQARATTMATLDPKRGAEKLVGDSFAEASVEQRAIMAANLRAIRNRSNEDRDGWSGEPGPTW
jgi:hypothetical protein